MLGLEHLAAKADEDVTIDPNAGQQPVAPAAQEPGLQTVELEDVDDIELREALAAEGAEEPEGRSQPEQDDTNPNPPQPAAAAEPKPGDQRQPVMIAKPRFDEVLERAKTAERRLAEQAAEAVQLKQQLEKHTGPAVNPELGALDAQIDELATKFDNGEITYKELKAQERALQNRRDEIREQEIVNRATARAVESVPKAPAGSNGWLDEQTANVTEQYGAYIDAIPLHMFASTVDHVKASLLAQGVKLDGSDRATAILRQEIGKYAQQEHEYFARASGITPIKPNAQSKPQARPTPGNQPTPEQRRAKLELQGQMEPDINAMQRGTGSDTMLSEAQIEEMDEEAIAALPVATRNRLLGLS